MTNFKIAFFCPLMFFLVSNLSGQEAPEKNYDSLMIPDQTIQFSFKNPAPVRSFREILDRTNADIIINEVNKLK